jgi:hypothetical protein
MNSESYSNVARYQDSSMKETQMLRKTGHAQWFYFETYEDTDTF